MSKIKNFNSNLRENGSEAVKNINLPLSALKITNWTIFQSQWDLPLLLKFI